MAYLAPKLIGGGFYLAPATPPDSTPTPATMAVGWTEGDETAAVYIRNGADIAVPASRTVRFAGENRTVRF